MTNGRKCGILIPSLHIDTEIRVVRRQDDNSGYGCEFVKLNQKEEEEILPPAELLKQYFEKRAALDHEIDKTLAEIQKILGIDNKSVN